MVVEFTWAERADNEAIAFELLVDWWWLVNAACYGFKVVYRDGVWVVVTIPANYIKGVSAVCEGVDHSLFFDEDFEFAMFIEGF